MTNLLKRLFGYNKTDLDNSLNEPLKQVVDNWDKWSKLDDKIQKTKAYVPWQIWVDHNHNNQPENNMEEPSFWEKRDNIRFTQYECGCKFEEGLKTYSFSGHWCENHCKKGGWIERPIDQND